MSNKLKRKAHVNSYEKSCKSFNQKLRKGDQSTLTITDINLYYNNLEELHFEKTNLRQIKTHRVNIFVEKLQTQFGRVVQKPRTQLG